MSDSDLIAIGIGVAAVITLAVIWVVTSLDGNGG